ncbi:hypothetical protein J6590_010085 [Homalodisca vitripennis]|nr:hypothetical protein J6590_010085 [Homalodisca vitripennis]
MSHLEVRELAQKSRKDTRVRRASPLPLRAIPNCHMDGSEPAPPPSLPPSPPAPAPEPSSSRRLPPPEPRVDRPRKSSTQTDGASRHSKCKHYNNEPCHRKLGPATV